MAFLARSAERGQPPATRGRSLRPAPGNWFAPLAGGLLLLYLFLPVLGLVLYAIGTGGLASVLTRPVVLQSLRLSVVTTLAVLVIAFVLGSPLALFLARHRFPGSSIVETLVDLPIVLPPAVAGVALLLTLGRRGLLGGALDAVGIELPFTTVAVVLAQTFVAVPFYVRAARAGFQGVPREIEQSAMVEGASSFQVFRLITAPLAAPSLLSGAVLCWARALGEFGATIMFAGSLAGKTQTMPLAIYAAIEDDLPSAVGLSLILLVVSFILLLGLRHWFRGADDIQM